MSVPDIIWDGTGTHAAHIIQHLRRDGYDARLCQSRWEIHVIDPAGALHRIHPTPHADPMTMRVSVERSLIFDAPWLVFGPVKGRPLVLAYFYEWAEAIRYAHHYAERSRT